MRSRDAAQVTAIDLIQDFKRAEISPRGTFEIASERVGDVVYPALVGPVPSRMIWPLNFPGRAMVRVFAAAAPANQQPMRLRVGVSDHRIYEGLAEVLVSPADRRWVELRANLSGYAGWQWSLFYRPDRTTWRLVLSADATGAAPGRVIWGSPEILTDTEAAQKYAASRRKLASR